MLLVGLVVGCSPRDNAEDTDRTVDANTGTGTEPSTEWATLNVEIDAIRDESGIPALGYVLVVGFLGRIYETSRTPGKP